MSLKKQLRAERHRRLLAEREAAQLRAQLAEARQAAPEATQHPGLAQVVTRLMQTEQRLEDQRDLVRLVIDSSPNLVYVEDEQHQCILANRRYTHLLAQQAELVTAEVPTLAEVTDVAWGANAVSFEECYRLQDGQEIWFSTTRLPLVQADGLRYLLTFSSDITDLKRAHRIAEESVRSKQDFLANMSHEIRTPLHGIMGLVALMKKEPLSDEQADYAGLIQSSTEGLLVVINDVLDFAKIEAGSLQLERIPFDIAKTVRDAVQIMAFRLEEKGLLLRYEGFDQPLPLVQGDPFRLNQVIVNLVSNAIKFTHQGGITLSLEAHPPTGSSQAFTFRVADTGIGISPDHLEQVFKSFQQGDSHIARLYGGTGLGLTICQNLVELQGGRLSVESTLGEGSCFSFRLTYALSEAPLVREAAAPPPTHLLQGLHVLLVEDNSINQLIAVSMLGQWDVRVDMAQNGEDALVKASQRPYDIILMDIQMPQLDGFEATARLRATDGPNRHAPIVALTADAIRISGNTSQAAGFTDYLIKPYSEAALCELLARTVRRPLPLPRPEPLAPAAPSAQPPTARRHYDLQQLGRLATDEVFVRQILELFVERVPRQVAAMQEALAVADWPAAARLAHGLKTTFGTLRIQPETRYLQKLEEMTEMGVPVAVAHPFVAAVVQGTAQFIDLFTAELTRMRSFTAASSVPTLHLSQATSKIEA